MNMQDRIKDLEAQLVQLRIHRISAEKQAAEAIERAQFQRTQGEVSKLCEGVVQPGLLDAFSEHLTKQRIAFENGEPRLRVETELYPGGSSETHLLPVTEAIPLLLHSPLAKPFLTPSKGPKGRPAAPTLTGNSEPTPSSLARQGVDVTAIMSNEPPIDQTMLHGLPEAG